MVLGHFDRGGLHRLFFGGRGENDDVIALRTLRWCAA